MNGTRRPLVLTGGPAAGKTSTGRWLAEQRPRAAFVDVDDVRQMVVSGHEAWGGAGAAQRLLGAQNACALARRFDEHGFDVVLADVLTPRTAAAYREELPGCLLVHLALPLAEAQRRAGKRQVWLTDAEFEHLHREHADDLPPVDHRLEVGALSLDRQRAAVEALWSTAGRGSGP